MTKKSSKDKKNEITGDITEKPQKIDTKKFYKNKKGKIQFNETCIECPYECKQSWRASIVSCKYTKILADKEKQETKRKKKGITNADLF